MTFHVYILRVANGKLYVGSADNLVRRFAEHQAGNGAKTTALFRPVELLYSEPHPDRSSAAKGERQIKRVEVPREKIGVSEWQNFGIETIGS